MDRAKHRRRDAAAKTHMRLACFPEDAGPTGLKLSIGLDVLQ